MTNQVNQAFETFVRMNRKIFIYNDDHNIYYNIRTNKIVIELQSLWALWQAASKASEKEINSLKAIPTQSLAEHDNDVIERIALALENAEGEFKTLPEYVALVRGMKNE